MKTITDCRECKDYRKCPYGKDWYSYAEIRWCPYQIIWLIQEFYTLSYDNWMRKSDIWPTPPYEVTEIKSRFRTRANFIELSETLAELEKRFEGLGRRLTALLITQIEAGRQFNPDPAKNTFYYEARQALLYLKGYRRKKQGFSEWLRDKRKKSTKNVVLSSA